MSYKALFYWLTVADNAKYFFLTFTILFTIVSCIAWLAYLANTEPGEDNNKRQAMARKWIWYSMPFSIVFWALMVFTPSRKDALLIVAGGATLDYLSQDSTARQLPKDLVNFISVELKNAAVETGLNLQINSNKEKMMEKVKTLTAEELITLMKQDTTYKQLILQ